ncbi:TPA: hypothetical protein N0F65_005764 [Lagenidium giganteum]|uniref:DDE Tnp4 domain-containing protein n=1 Tax=Lagenidium giganteum TaxID=4803 RepID=A0AAV2YWQ0_9STRA|nr:TPA: hypothetical protein N0F65_005764 [Lagenidium giganteum]
MLLRRRRTTVYPHRKSCVCSAGDSHIHLEMLFGRSASALSTISNHSLNLIHEKFDHLFPFDAHGFTDADLTGFADAVFNKSAALPSNCPSDCRPKKLQCYVYNGRKRKHALKYQSIVTPDGLILHFDRPVLGTRHDSYMLAYSDLVSESPSSW